MRARDVTGEVKKVATLGNGAENRITLDRMRRRMAEVSK